MPSHKVTLNHMMSVICLETAKLMSHMYSVWSLYTSCQVVPKETCQEEVSFATPGTSDPPIRTAESHNVIAWLLQMTRMTELIQRSSSWMQVPGKGCTPPIWHSYSMA